VRNTLALSVFTVGLALTAPLAASATNSTNATIATSATVIANCKITTSPIAFGAYDPLIANNSLAAVAQAPQTVYCTKGSYPNVNVSSSSGLMKLNPSESTGLNYTYSMGAPDFGTHQAVVGSQTVVVGENPIYVYGVVSTYTYCDDYEFGECSGYATGYNYGYIFEGYQPVYGSVPVYGQVANPAVAAGISSGITWMLSATVPGGQDEPVGSYQDSITVTLNF
jgi:spore coat protein U-like protein